MLGGMTEHREAVVVAVQPERTPSAQDGLVALLAAYHLRTEAEKGRAVTGVDGLPGRYRAEVADPWSAFADDDVLVAFLDDATVGCLILTAPDGGTAEIKRLWTDPAFRGRGIASALLGAALARAAGNGVGTVRLSVWEWRTGAVALYERFGFRVTGPWDGREGLVCMSAKVPARAHADR